MKIVVSASHRGGWPEGVERTYPHVFLVRDTWNDYGFETLFVCTVHLSDEDSTELGGVKIAYFGHTYDTNIRDELKPEQPRLDPEYFSLGQTLDYYERLATLPTQLRQSYAEVMRDIPLLDIPRDRLIKEPSFETSLLRTSGAREALDKAPGLFGRREREVDGFVYTTTLPGAAGPHSVPFDFAERDGLPHRINVLVGVNGVGKTQLMARLAILMSSFEEKARSVDRTAERGSLRDVGSIEPKPSLYSVIAISFSAFDDFELPTTDESRDFRYTYCGLRNLDGERMDDDALAARIRYVLGRMDDSQIEMALAALSDALDLGLERARLLNDGFHQTLSAGQRIVANIIVDLCLHLRQRSLVLLDEPETHLHPQLVTRLLSVLDELLAAFDSMAVIATHSPIVVQQTLSARVHIIRRLDGDVPLVDTPPIETFGENLSDIVRVVFDAPESDRGYRAVMDDLLERNGGNVEAVERLFDGRLGYNAQIQLRSRRPRG